ncbi:uncharacterized protein EHS24_005417 [Apiotrichum porosum]|uniref:Transcription elongation factor 1 homolog n=1 Tax=Apiotrichum porosum TaxID=105984 RepID=A0A427XCP9_9TREE|nr:uncharacterized protein EHS24_005417 [Apiotrichum porosum]RSH76670.1 hypothetical protein EHS24_005417 [Apiotrichum porosum]
MGKRKSSKKPVARRQNEPLSTTFKCLFCHHEKSVSCKIDRQSMFGHLNCKVCGQKFTSPINNLSVAVDVYCDWVDACEEVRIKQPKKVVKPPPRRSASPEARRPSKRQSARDAYDDEDDDDDDDDFDHRRPHKVSRDYDDDDDDE